MKNFTAILNSILLVPIAFLLSCNRLSMNNPCEIETKSFQNFILAKALFDDTSSHCGIQLFPGSGTIQNIKSNGVLHSGFLIGTITSGNKVTVSIDSTVPQPATISGTNWIYKLPTGSNTWREGSKHTVSVKFTSEIQTVSIIKGNNKDVNGDGYADVIIGSPQYAGTGGASQGRVYIFHSTGTAGIANADLSSGALTNTILTGETGSHQLGSSVSLGDFNGDGYADVIAGAAVNQQGKAYIFHSAGTAGIASVDLSAGGSANTVLTGEISGNQFGISSATGDVNGDGFADVIVGARGYAAAGGNQGRVYIFHSAGVQGIANVDLSAGSSANTTLTGQASVNLFGTSIASGDVNGDGFADVIVGAANQGRAYVFHSVGTTGIANVDLSAGVLANTTLIGPSPATVFGNSVASGDVNGDGFADVIVGANAFNTNQGRAYIFHSAGTTGIANVDISAGGSANATFTGGATNDSLGLPIAFGDVNGDGYADAIVAARGFGSNKGRTYIFQSAGTPGIASVDISSGGFANSTFTGGATNDTLGGFAIAFGDVNGDGFADAIVPARGFGSNKGRTYIFHSAGTTGFASVDLGTGVLANTTLTGEAAGNLFGNSIAFGYQETDFIRERSQPFPTAMDSFLLKLFL